MTLPSISFGVTGLAFLGAFIWAMTKRAGPAGRWQVRGALLASTLWAAAQIPPAHDASWPWLPAVELLRYGGWLLAMPAIANAAGSAWIWRLNLLLWVAGAVLALFSPVLAALLLAFAGLVNIEQLLRNARALEQPAMKLCVIGLGAMFACDLVLYSEYALRGYPDEQLWALRGLVNALLLPFFLLGAARLTGAAPGIFVSRQAVFYTTAFVAVGLYLLAMALASQYLLTSSGTWSQWLRPLLLAGAALVLVALLASQSPWRRLRVFLAKHFYRNKYDYRVEWLRFVRTLAQTEAGDVGVTCIRAIAQIFESPRGVLFLREEGGAAFELAAVWSADEQDTGNLAAVPTDHDLVRFMEQKEWVVDLDEYRSSPQVYQSIRLPSFLVQVGARWRIVSPLFERESLQGFLVLQRPPDPFVMTFEDRDLLRMVGRHVATLLAQQAADRRLAESRQFDTYNRFAAFVMHDLKNSVAQLQLLASNAARHRHNPEFIDDAFETIENTAGRITRLIGQLQSREAATARRPVAVEQVVSAAIERCSSQLPSPASEIPEAGLRVNADPERLCSALEHVIRNAQEAAGEAGAVKVKVQADQGLAVITIVDTGPGMEQAFIRDRLFRPFDSTKGARGMGVGAYQARAYVLELGGSVEVQSAPGSGTRFVIRIPT